MSLLDDRLQGWDGSGDQPDMTDYEHCDFCGADTSSFTRIRGTGGQQHPPIIWEMS